MGVLDVLGVMVSFRLLVLCNMCACLMLDVICGTDSGSSAQVCAR